jgi:hypothetical protein
MKLEEELKRVKAISEIQIQVTRLPLATCAS